MDYNKRSVGTRYEELALEHALSRGAVLLEKNFRCSRGEIDLILKDGSYLVFVEVKYRAGDSYGAASEAVGSKKIKRICRVSDFYRFTRKIAEDTPVRFDVFAIDSEDGGSVRVKWIKNAFSYIPSAKNGYR